MASDPSPVILITGASSGIGEATARRFAAAGYRVVLAARRIERLQALARDLQSEGKQALPIQTDVGHLGSLQALVQRVLDEYGQVDVLFNNAGFGRLGWLENLDAQEDIATQLQVNLLGLILVTRAILPHMIARRKGHIINMSSAAGFVATPTYSIYAASKFAVRGFTDALRREVGVWGIHVSGIYPGGVQTEFASHTGAWRKTSITTPAFLTLSSDQVAREVLALAQHPRRARIIPWPLRLGVLLAMHFPGLADWLMEQWFVRPERDL